MSCPNTFSEVSVRIIAGCDKYYLVLFMFSSKTMRRGMKKYLHDSIMNVSGP